MTTVKLDENISRDAKIEIKVSISRSVILRALAGNQEWLEFSGEDVVVAVSLSPEGWRGLGRAFSESSQEPEWLLENARAISDDFALSKWSECRPNDLGPGAWLSEESCMLSIRAKRFVADV